MPRYLRLSLFRPPYNFFWFFTELVFGWFFEAKLENGLSHDRNRWEKIGKDAKRYRKIGKDTKRWKKMGIDGGLIGERGFPVMLQTRTCGP